MSRWDKRLRRFRLIVRARKIQVDTAAAHLHQLQLERAASQTQLEDVQKRYTFGISRANAARQACDRTVIDSIEAGVDKLKADWAESLRQLRDVEARERLQRGVVTAAQRNLEAAERLVEKVRERAADEDARLEQAMLDDVARRTSSTGGVRDGTLRREE